jgi:Right handed beta helix region
VLTITGTAYYVSPNGSDSNNGTSPSSPWRTIHRVNQAALRPGDGVLFQGGATFSDEVLMPIGSGASGSLIVFGSYGSGNATLAEGIWFREKSWLGFENLSIGSGGNLQGKGSGIIVESCTISGDSLAVNGMGSGWTIDNNDIDHTGNSGMLLEGDSFTVSGNTITNTGLDASIPYGKHGIYLKVSNATVTNNTIANFSDAGISARYHNETIAGNHISNGPFGIAFFQDDPAAGTSHWMNNVITGTTVQDLYVSRSDAAGSTRESFVIEGNNLQRAAGGYMDLEPTSGTYAVLANTLL